MPGGLRAWADYAVPTEAQSAGERAMRYPTKKASLLAICTGGPVLALLIGAGFIGLSAALSNAPSLRSTRDLSDATALDREIYYWRGALLGPAVISRGDPIGMFVGRVAPDSAAAKAKLQPGDIVVALDGMPVGTPRFLALAVADQPIGPVISLRVWRDGAEKQLTLLVPSANPTGTRGSLLRVG